MSDIDRRIEELRASQADTDRLLKETDALLKASIAAAEKRSATLDNQIREVSNNVNGIGKSNGMVAQEFFFTAIENGDRKIFGEQFDQCYSYVKRHGKASGYTNEQDIILFNCDSMALIEVKYRARKEDVQKIIDRLPAFQTLYPEYKGRRKYLGLASLSFDMDVEKDCTAAGIAIIKLMGETVVINDKHLKAF
jgi:hypothetical protein